MSPSEAWRRARTPPGSDAAEPKLRQEGINARRKKKAEHFGDRGYPCHIPTDDIKLFLG